MRKRAFIYQLAKEQRRSISSFFEVLLEREAEREIRLISDNLRESRWKCGCIASVDSKGRQIWVVAAERGDAGCFIVHADEKLTAFVEIEAAIRRAMAL